jgi:hypothetical protein
VTEAKDWCWLTHQKITLDNDQALHEDGSVCTCADDVLFFAGYDKPRHEMTDDEAKEVAENMHKIRNRHKVGSRVVTIKEFD